MGAWRFLRWRLGTTLCGHLPLQSACRPESASPATGSAGTHKLEQAQLIQRAFGEGQVPATSAEDTSGEDQEPKEK
jgi:2-oxoglutarate dehydrogenase complex dehydrogenase (E1) component-like enzyme